MPWRECAAMSPGKEVLPVSKILLGVTGSIAAYKAAELTRLLLKGGHEVQVVMTAAATKFVAPLTFQTLSKHPVMIEQFGEIPEWKPEHIALSEDCDLVLVAPATANTIAKICHGIADNLLLSTILATKKPVYIAPAMNDGMWENPATRENIRIMKERGFRIIEPGTGELACGTSGRGHLADIDAIVGAIQCG